MPTYRITKLTISDSPGGAGAIEVTAQLVDVATGAQSVTVTDIDKVDLTGPGAIQTALADANEDIDFTL